jgi:enoyl-CoA hydratase/carnithine racemase
LAAEGHISVDLEGMIGRICIHNAAKRNAMSTTMWRSLAEIAAGLAARAEVRTVLLMGEGTAAFSAGADITEFDEQRHGHNPSAYDDLVENTCRALEALPQTTIAIVRGACAGAGISIAASCDLRLASEGSYFVHPVVRLGLGYDVRGIERLLRVYGMAAARYLLLSGERIDAGRAHALGMIDQQAAVDTLEGAAVALAKRTSLHAPFSVAGSKAALRAFSITAEPARLQQARLLAQRADQSADYQEGRRAFAEKRAPQFKGR